MKLTGVVIECNYPDDNAEAGIPNECTVDQLCDFIKRLVSSEPEMTSFVITAAMPKREA